MSYFRQRPAHAVQALRRRLAYLKARLEAPRPPPGEELRFLLSEYHALIFALRCVVLCRSYAVVAFDNFGEPLFTGQAGKRKSEGPCHE